MYEVDKKKRANRYAFGLGILPSPPCFSVFSKLEAVSFDQPRALEENVSLSAWRSLSRLVGVNETWEERSRGEEEGAPGLTLA